MKHEIGNDLHMDGLFGECALCCKVFGDSIFRKNPSVSLQELLLKTQITLEGELLGWQYKLKSNTIIKTEIEREKWAMIF